MTVNQNLRPPEPELAKQAKAAFEDLCEAIATELTSTIFSRLRGADRELQHKTLRRNFTQAFDGSFKNSTEVYLALTAAINSLTDKVEALMTSGTLEQPIPNEVSKKITKMLSPQSLTLTKTTIDDMSAIRAIADFVRFVSELSSDDNKPTSRPLGSQSIDRNSHNRLGRS